MQETLAERTYLEIRRMVLEGGLRPGDPLVYRTLARRMKVSLAPVREAVLRLAAEGLIENVPGAGASVRRFDTRDLEELYVLREALESAAAAEAARRRTEEELETLEAVCRDSAPIPGELRRRKPPAATKEIMERWLVLEEQFHAVLIEAARNRLLSKAVRDARALGRIFGVQREHPALLTPEVAVQTCRGHAALAEAVRERDAEGARRIMADHIRNGRRMVLDSLRRSPPADG
jgi:DNA-binding GntR family transcriptional regulator